MSLEPQGLPPGVPGGAATPAVSLAYGPLRRGMVTWYEAPERQAVQPAEVPMTSPYPQIPPDIFRLGPLRIRWYGVMYVVGYAVGYRIIKRRVARGMVRLTGRELDALIGYLVTGMLVGARIMYAVAYQPGHFLGDPLEFLAIWHGGLSFHGALIGIALAAVLVARLHGIAFWRLADTLAMASTPGLFFGRLANFINADLHRPLTPVPSS